MDYNKIIEKEIFFIRSIPVDQIEKLIDLLYTPFLGSKIALSGMGKAGQMAHTLATTLSSTGISSFFIHPAEAQHGDLGMIGKYDKVIVFSNSGKTREILEFMKLCRILYSDIQIYSIVGNPNSEIQKESDFSIVYGPIEEVCPLGLTPTTSTTCMSIISDLIVCGFMERTKLTKEQYAVFHHGGYLNLKATGNE